MPGIFPLEMHLGIEAGLATPALAERIGLQSADHTQQQVLDWLERDHGIKWLTESLRKVTASLSDGLSGFRQEAQEKKILEFLKKAENSTGPHRPVLAVGRDGIMVPMRRGGKQEAATATVSVIDRNGRRVGTVYLGQMPEPGQGTLSDKLTSLLIGVLTKWDGCPLRHVYITDAGHHPQEYYETVLKKMADPKRPGHLLEWQWIVDFWHACCYLTKLREALFGDSPAGWKWFKRMRHWLRHRKHGIADVLRSATQHWNLLKDRDVAREGCRRSLPRVQAAFLSFCVVRHIGLPDCADCGRGRDRMYDRKASRHIPLNFSTRSSTMTCPPRTSHFMPDCFSL